MIFVQNIGSLQQNNLCVREKPYCETVILPRDVNLQGFLPREPLTNYNISILLFDCTGTVLQANVTDAFRILIGTSIYGQRYFNLELREWSAAFKSDCFILRVEVKNNGITVFNKFTEMYCRRQGDATCFLAIPESDWFAINNSGFVEINCVRFDQGIGLVDAGYVIEYNETNRAYLLFFPCETTDYIVATKVVNGVPTCLNLPVQRYINVDDPRCQHPLILLESLFDCQDDISGAYYGDPVDLMPISTYGVTNDKTVIHRAATWIPGEFTEQPTELKREKSYLGKTHRVDYIKQHLLTGLTVFPGWKKLELERLLTGKRVYINQVEYVVPTGTPFEKDTISCTCSFIFRLKVEDFPLVNDYNCLDKCITLCSYFVIPAGQRNQPYYDDNGTLIGYTLDALMTWYQAFPEVTRVVEFAGNNLNCDPVAIVKITASGYIPSFFYYNSSSIDQRVYGKRDDCTVPTRLCEDYPQDCETPSGIFITLNTPEDPECQTIELAPIVLISADDWENCSAMIPAGSWTIQPGAISQHLGDNVRIALVATSPDYTDETAPFVASAIIGYLGAGCRPSVSKILTPFNTPGMPPNMSLQIDPDGKITASAEIDVDTGGGTLEIPLITFTKS